MVGSAAVAAVFAEPAWLAMTAVPGGDLGRAGGSRIGMADVEVLRSVLRNFEVLHRRHGGGLLRAQVVQLLNQQSRRAVEGSYSDEVGGHLLSALSELAFLAGLITVDTGRHALGHRYYTQALGLAMRAGDKSSGGNVLAEMSRETIDLSARATGDDVLDAGQHAAALARSALYVVGDRATPAVSAYIHAIEARGLAVLGDTKGVLRALGEAQRAFERGPAEEPAWLGYYTEVDLTSDIGQCLRDSGRPRQGLVMLERALYALPEGRVTSRAKTQIHIAAAQLALRDFEAADHVTAAALDSVGGLSSERTVERVRALRRRAGQVGAGRVGERITAFLAS